MGGGVEGAQYPWAGTLGHYKHFDVLYPGAAPDETRRNLMASSVVENWVRRDSHLRYSQVVKVRSAPLLE